MRKDEEFDKDVNVLVGEIMDFLIEKKTSTSVGMFALAHLAGCAVKEYIYDTGNNNEELEIIRDILTTVVTASGIGADAADENITLN